MASRKRKTRARADDIPSSFTPAPLSASARPDAQSSQTTTTMLQSLFQGQVIIMQSLQMVAPPGSILSVEQFLEQTPQQERSDEAVAPLEPTPAQVEPVPADPHSPVADPSSPELEAAPPSSPIIIISEDPTESTFGEAVALSDSPVFHLMNEEETQDQSQDS
ncbi:hypothetical protein GmHk_01G000621 [Glycine max]|nr:hypothetical protein GmHk_01G000621 [Glycine max]